MKIKTICRNFDWVEEFDKLVNEAVAEGWYLTKREVIPGVAGVNTNSRRLLYAELVQLDPEPESEALDPIEALNVVRAFCNDNKCKGCLLEDFCARHLLDNEGPVDWVLPREVSEA
jgi:hypothetical protein